MPVSQLLVSSVLFPLRCAVRANQDAVSQTGSNIFCRSLTMAGPKSGGGVSAPFGIIVSHDC